MAKKPKTPESMPVPNKGPNSISLVFPEGFDPAQDKFVAHGGGGYASLTVKKPNGQVQSQSYSANNRMQTYTTFDGSNLDKEERKKIVREMSSQGHSQAKIGIAVGVSQATVSNDLKEK